MLLLGYQRRFEYVRPPWSALRTSEKTYMKCLHSDRNAYHQGKHLNISFTGPKALYTGATNWIIIQRGEDAFDQFDECTYHCTLGNRNRTGDDGLQQLASGCEQRCGFWTAAHVLLRTIIDPFYNPTKDDPKTVESLPDYCPCSFKLAWHSLRRTHDHLPRPRSIHPFYTDRNTSSLYRKQDVYSWWVWLWGNEFFSPWRRTNIDQVSYEELLRLFAEGH
jgi:hypothetical protein